MTTSNSILNNAPFLRTSRNFPQESQPLAVEVNRSYVDIASAVNNRIISIYPANRPIATGESWFFFQNRRQQSLRQIYEFTSAGNIPHGITFSEVSQISPKSYGSFTDGTNWYGTTYATNVAVAGLVTFYVTSVNIVILSGAGAPAITKGTIVLEWISQI